MNYPADSTAKLCQGGKGRYVGREGVPVDNCSREKISLLAYTILKLQTYEADKGTDQILPPSP